MVTISQKVTDVRNRLQQGLVGGRVWVDPLDRLITLINSNPQAAQVSTILFTGATNDKTYTVVINGSSISFTADASAVVAELSAGMTLAINSSALVRGQVAAVDDTVDTVTLTGLQPGEVFTLTESDAEITIATTTTAADAAAVGFGKAMVRLGFDADELNDPLGAVAAAALFTAQVDTLAVTFVAAQSYTITVTYAGRAYVATFLADTNDNTTATAMRAALVDALSGIDLTVTGATDEAIITADTAGDEFVTSKTQDITLVSTRAVGTSFALSFAGVSLHTLDEEVTAIGEDGDTASYPANAGVKVAARSVVWVSNSQAPSQGDLVYVELTAGTTAGDFFNAGTTTRVLLPGAVWDRDTATATDNIAAVRFAA